MNVDDEISESGYIEYFRKIQAHLEDQEDNEERVERAARDVDKVQCEMAVVLLEIHEIGEEAISPACLKVRELFGKAREAYIKLKQVVPPGQYHRYCNYWRETTQNFFCHISLTIWLEAGIVTRYETARDILIDPEDQDGFQLELEDFLISQMLFISDLSRLATNLVLLDQYDRVMPMYLFVLDLYAEISQFSFLRKENMAERLEELEADVTDIEELMYELGLRELSSGDPPTLGAGEPSLRGLMACIPLSLGTGERSLRGLTSSADWSLSDVYDSEEEY